ncbi:MAG: methylmalonyl-CoA carboxyltransferase [Planctomycetota bacterium]|nr:MAG: methylmalonyl-CoA carboxyltransferase [Planctomycetota bacterium]
MSTTREKHSAYRVRLAELYRQGGPARLEKQHQKGKLSARERLALLFDEGSFHEIDGFVTHRARDFGLDGKKIAADGVVTGFGLVEGRTVYAYSQDFTSSAGTLGEMHARKICKIMDLALKAGSPIVGMNDSGGARIQEGVDALAGYGEVFFRNSCASGVVPQISAIMGPCAGGAVYSPALTDFVYMVRRSSYMFITGPRVIKQVTGEDYDNESLGGADVHSVSSGVCHMAVDSDEECIAGIRHLLSYLPANNMSNPPHHECEDPIARPCPELDSIIPDSTQQGYDMRQVMESLFDIDSILEMQPDYAPNLLTAFARLGGSSVGIIANQPQHLAGCLDINASDKASRFVRFCDAFNIPLVTLVDVPGFLPGGDQEHGGIIRHGAKMLWAYSEATVPKVTLILRKDYGGSYLAMCSRQQGADFTFAWPTAEIAVMGAEGAVEVIFSRDIKNAKDPVATRSEKLNEYREAFYSPYRAAARSYIDNVIMPNQSRMVLHQALTAMSNKREVRPPRKHGNIPL